jgi:Pvc16 N-terminal domain
MADFRAIGGVSATLQTLLRDRLEVPGGLPVPTITIGPPPFALHSNASVAETPRLNLYLYRVTENGYLQNQEISGRGTRGAFGRPPLSLNLHYLITAYGNRALPQDPTAFDDSDAQILLGNAMRVLHDFPMVSAGLTTVRRPSGIQVLHDSLRDEFDRLKTTIEPMTLEDLTKVWTALSLRMRLGAAYVVNVVQIESRRSPTFPRPVGQPISTTVPPLPSDAPSPGPMVYVFPIQAPAIADVRVRRAGGGEELMPAYARIGDTLVLRGSSLAGPITTVAFGDVEVPASFALGDRVEAVIPDATVPGSGSIPPELQLQPGTRAAKVVVRDPNVPQSSFRSNEAPFMLVPLVNPALLVYAAGPPRTLTIGGTRLIGPTPGGETVIGRAVIPRTAYIGTPSPTQIMVPIPDTLPMRDVRLMLGGVLPDPISLGAGPLALDITIDGTTHSVTANLPTQITRASAANILESLIHDAAPADPRFTGTRVDLWHDKLLIVPGGLTNSIAIVSPGGSTFDASLGLTAAQPAGAASALVSGVLPSPATISAQNARVQLRVGAQPPIIVPIPPAVSLAGLADGLQSAINTIGGVVEYTAAQVAVTGSQLIVIPGAVSLVRFDAAPGDETSVAELLLRARFTVRVRVNGAESIDADALLELPQ